MNARVTCVLSAGAPSGAERDRLRAAIAATGADCVTLPVIPFAGRFAGPVPDLTGAVLCYGVGSLVRAARREGWGPSGWDGPALGMAPLMAALGPDAWNHSGRLLPLSRLRREAARPTGEVFLRPEHTDKSFAGRLHGRASLDAWLEGLDRADWADGADPEFLLAPPRLPEREWRLWIVAGRVVAGCRYARNGAVETVAECPDRIRDFARGVLPRHDPLPAYVLDIGEDAAGLGAIELNPVNSAGFYAADPAPIFADLVPLAARSAS